MNINTSCTITGHFPNNLRYRKNKKSKLIKDLTTALTVRLLLILDSGYDTFYTGMDTLVSLIFGEIVIAFKKSHPNIKLIAILAQEEMHEEVQEFNGERYLNLLADCDEVITLNKNHHKNCYRLRDKYLIKQSERLIAVCDGKSKDETYKTILMARKLGRTITIMDSITLKTRTSKRESMVEIELK